MLPSRFPEEAQGIAHAIEQCVRRRSWRGPSVDRSQDLPHNREQSGATGSFTQGPGPVHQTKDLGKYRSPRELSGFRAERLITSKGGSRVVVVCCCETVIKEAHHDHTGH